MYVHECTLLTTTTHLQIDDAYAVFTMDQLIYVHVCIIMEKLFKTSE